MAPSLRQGQILDPERLVRPEGSIKMREQGPAPGGLPDQRIAKRLRLKGSQKQTALAGEMLGGRLPGLLRRGKVDIAVRKVDRSALEDTGPDSFLPQGVWDNLENQCHARFTSCLCFALLLWVQLSRARHKGRGAANVLLWPALDCRKNSIYSVARGRFSANQLHGKGQADMLEMLAGTGIDFDTDYPDADRHGVFFMRVTGERDIDEDTWAKIPEKHRTESRRMIRSWVSAIDMPFFRTVQNRAEVVFESAPPVTAP